MSESESTEKITLSVSSGLLSTFDETIKGAHYKSRSGAISEAMRDFIDKIKRRSSR